jgi:hypothetical protein
MDAEAIDDMLDGQIQALDNPKSEGGLIDQFFLNSSARDIDKKIEENSKIHIHKRRQRSEMPAPKTTIRQSWNHWAMIHFTLLGTKAINFVLTAFGLS